LVNYVDGLKQSIIDTDSSLNSKLEKYLEQNKNLFIQEDSKIFEKEIETTKKLTELLEK
jgi:hypothetical protein